jgi:preprotein translocase SecE subunit
MADIGSEREKNPTGMIGRGTNFFSESVEEMKKVVPPTKQETIQATLVTLFIMIFIAVCLALLDLLFRTIMSFILG